MTALTLTVGATVLRRHFIHHDVARVWVGRVVSDDDRGVLIWVEDGSPWLEMTLSDGRTLRTTSFDQWWDGERVLGTHRWRGAALMFHPRGQSYSLWYFFDPDGRFDGWYANLEVPAQRWRDGDLCGLDTVDWDLDVLAEPDRTWRWKDEQEFAGRLRDPRYWVDDEAEVRSAGAAVVALIEAGAFPFDGTWTDFRPDPTWRMPS